MNYIVRHSVATTKYKYSKVNVVILIYIRIKKDYLSKLVWIQHALFPFIRYLVCSMYIKKCSVQNLMFRFALTVNLNLYSGSGSTIQSNWTLNNQFRFGFKHCSQCSEPDHSQSTEFRAEVQVEFQPGNFGAKSSLQSISQHRIASEFLSWAFGKDGDRAGFVCNIYSVPLGDLHSRWNEQTANEGMYSIHFSYLYATKQETWLDIWLWYAFWL